MKRLVLAGLIFCAVVTPASAGLFDKRHVEKGNVLYNEGAYEDAVKSYQRYLDAHPESDIAHFDTGAALYKMGKYPESAERFERALVGNDPVLEQQASYNAGNAKFKYGLAQEKKDTLQAIELLKQSIRHYERALELAEKDDDARYNLAIARKELERLLRGQKQQEQKEQQQNDQQKEQNEQQNGQKGQTGQQQNGQQDQQNQQPDQKDQQQNDRQPEEAQQQGGQQDQYDQQQEQNDQQQGDQQEQQGQRQSGQQERKDQSQNGQQGQGERANTAGGQGEDGAGAPRDASASTGSDGRVSGAMTQDEARMLLETYSTEEEPAGLFKENIPVTDSAEPERDW